jgi:DNA replication protein DnaC
LRARVTELDETHHPKIAQLAISTVRFLFACLLDIRESGTWFVVEGNTGSGKSHVAKRIRKFYDGSKIEFWDGKSRDHIANALWGYWPEVAGWDDDDFNDFVAEIGPAKLVILDDIGAEEEKYRSGAPAARLARVLERCDSRWVFATTNVPSRQWKDRWDQRVSDRLLAAKRLSLFEVPSYRGKK